MDGMDVFFVLFGGFVQISLIFTYPYTWGKFHFQFGFYAAWEPRDPKRFETFWGARDVVFFLDFFEGAKSQKY